MVKNFIYQLESTLGSFITYIPPGLILCAATAFIEKHKYLEAYRHEFIGTLLMIVFTFSAGKWVGGDSIEMAWGFHGLGVIAADYFGGGPHVNPAVTFSMWSLGKCSYTEAYVRVAAQLAGGLISFPLYHAISEQYGLTPFGGPEFDTSSTDKAVEAFLSEFCATVCLMWAIYILNWELNFGTYHYIIKQSFTAVAIRVLIEVFPTAGPAMNPMLATCWAVFGVGDDYEFPGEFLHYFVYWVAPFMGALLASVLHVIYAGGTIFGSKLPIGPIKSTKKPKKD